MTNNIFHYVNGRIVPEAEAEISVMDLGLLRGYGVFDYAQSYNGRPFHLRDHIERLQKSAEQIQLDLPLSLDEIENAALELLEKNEPIDAGIRFLVTGGLSGKNLLSKGGKSSLIILFHPFTPFKKEHYVRGMSAITTSVLRYLPHVKTTNYMPAIFAMNQAFKAGADDALYLNQQGGIIEGTMCNIFFIKDGVLITDDSNQLIRGVTREIILKLAEGYYPIEFRALKLSEAVLCDEAFSTSSVKDVMPLVKIDHQNVGCGRPGPISLHLRSLFHAYIEEYFFYNSNLTSNKVTA